MRVKRALLVVSILFFTRLAVAKNNFARHLPGGVALSNIFEAPTRNPGGIEILNRATFGALVEPPFLDNAMTSYALALQGSIRLLGLAAHISGVANTQEPQTLSIAGNYEFFKSLFIGAGGSFKMQSLFDKSTYRIGLSLRKDQGFNLGATVANIEKPPSEYVATVGLTYITRRAEMGFEIISPALQYYRSGEYTGTVLVSFHSGKGLGLTGAISHPMRLNPPLSPEWRVGVCFGPKDPLSFQIVYFINRNTLSGSLVTKL